MNIVTENWDEILQTLKKEYQISEVPFNTWLKPLKVYKVEDNLVSIIVPSELAGLGLSYISNRYKLPLQVTISVVTGMDECEVAFIPENEIPTQEIPSYNDHVQDPRYE